MDLYLEYFSTHTTIIFPLNKNRIINFIDSAAIQNLFCHIFNKISCQEVINIECKAQKVGY